MTVLVDQDVGVHYGFVYVDSGVGSWDEEYDQRAGQRNGLLGAAQPGFLHIVTGMHTGLVPLRVERLDAAPPLEATAGEIVEASCDFRGPQLSISAFDGGLATVDVGRGGPHRARLSAWDYESGRETERYEPDEPVQDRYLLQLWPAPMAADVVVRATSATAGYWHRHAREHPPTVTPFDQAIAERRDRDARAEQERRWAYEQYLREWGGREPTDRLRQVREHAGSLIREQRELVDLIAALNPERQRAVAVTAARAACARDDGPVDWSPALAAVEAGRPLPRPFDDPDSTTELVLGQRPTRVTAFVVRVSPSQRPPRQPAHAGLAAGAAVRAAALADPLAAALAAIAAGSDSSPDLAAYFAGVRHDVGG